MRPYPLRLPLAGLVALFAVSGCDLIFGIVPGSSTVGTGDAGSTGGAGDAGSMGGAGDGGDAGPRCGTPFPSTPVLDDFNGADGPLGAPLWTPDTPGAYTIVDDQLFCSPGTPGSTFWNGVFGATEEVYVTVQSFETSDGELELILKNQGGAGEANALLIDYQPSTPGLGVYAPSGLIQFFPQFALQPHDQFGARICADGTLELFVNGSPAGSVDASMSYPSLQGTGRIGFYSSSLGDAGVTLDNFGGG
jgi:hypothetical protein